MKNLKWVLLIFIITTFILTGCKKQGIGEKNKTDQSGDYFTEEQSTTEEQSHTEEQSITNEQPLIEEQSLTEEEADAVVNNESKPIAENGEQENNSGSVENSAEIESAGSETGEAVSGEGKVLVNEEQESRIVSDINKVSEIYRDIYISADKGNTSSIILSKKTMKEIVEKIGNYGYVVYTEDATMQNYKEFLNFIDKIRKKEKADITIYNIYYDGLCRYEIQENNGKMQIIAAPATWNEGNSIKLDFVDVWDIDEWEFSDNGYFRCHVTYPKGFDEEGTSYGFRVMPLSDEARDYCEKYIDPIGYIGNNILLTNWDKNDMSDLNFNDIFGYLYNIEHKKEPEGNWERYIQNPSMTIGGVPVMYAIPAKEFESLLTKYFPVTRDKLKDMAIYNKDRNVYPWLMFYGAQFSPEPEVVDFTNNKDGSITLVVDAIDIMNDSTCDFTSTVTIMPNEDGTCKYLSNKIEIKSDNGIPIYSPRVTKDSIKRDYN